MTRNCGCYAAPCCCAEIIKTKEGGGDVMPDWKFSIFIALPTMIGYFTIIALILTIVFGVDLFCLKMLN